jgi:hypothetical protein
LQAQRDVAIYISAIWNEQTGVSESSSDASSLFTLFGVSIAAFDKPLK